MSSSITIALAVFGILIVLVTLFRGGGGLKLASALREAKRTGNADALVAALERLPERRQPDAFNAAIKQLWDDYKRETAAKVVHGLASRLPETRIAQYWIDQVQKVEPEIASKLFDEAFLKRHYRPEIAARCGQFG